MGIVGADQPFKIFDDEKVKPYLDAIEGDSRAPSKDEPASGGGDDDEPRPPMDPQVNVQMESMEH